MSNVKPDRHVEHDWWPDPIPGNVELTKDLTVEARKSSGNFAARNPKRVFSVSTFPVMPAVRSIGENGEVRSAILLCLMAR